jgi:hypothetical protein
MDLMENVKLEAMHKRTDSKYCNMQGWKYIQRQEKRGER